ncbi:Hsp20/alpha crystallin family protein [Pontiella agarivorans]|uniref:Hsp20/alpha crystallin family protein n=1 Tax=Pontiella agarivorans TaxID=3038953 RepID=A0ABU5MUY2_9BACT|nr:Hsp20/alpha crystallin family protein [Pontiella agarivorans]MDZ8118028.1 Hsp20/alpha crystallin family protein [Pontiella agarivorans]
MFHPVKRNSNVVYADPFAHIFESFFGDSARYSPAETKLNPQFEITETDDAFSVAAELPGLGKEQIEIVLENDVLTVKGEKKAEEQKEDRNCLYSTRQYGSFERKFQLPDSVDQAEVKAHYENGLLMLNLPKKPEAVKPAPRQIEVK